MLLDREQFRICTDILLPYVNTTPDDRRALVTQALFGSEVIEQITWTGKPPTFATNLVHQLLIFDGKISLIALLETLRENVGDATASTITDLISDLTQTSIVHPTMSASSPTQVSNTCVFISYARENSVFVDRLRDDFRDHRIPYWIDKEGLAPGTRNWEHSIRFAIQESSAVVWVVSPASYKSEYVSSELAVAELYARKIS